jgi:hypothetical protein
MMPHVNPMSHPIVEAPSCAHNVLVCNGLQARCATRNSNGDALAEAGV